MKIHLMKVTCTEKENENLNKKVSSEDILLARNYSQNKFLFRCNRNL